MKPISERQAQGLLQRWQASKASIRVSFSAAFSESSEGIISDVEASPGQTVAHIWLVGLADVVRPAGTESPEKYLVLRDCNFAYDGATLAVLFSDGRALYFRED